MRIVPLDGKCFPFLGGSGTLVHQVGGSTEKLQGRSLHMKICLLVGNPRAGSRTLEVGRLVADSLTRISGPAEIQEIDLAEVSHELLAWPSEPIDSLLKSVAATDVLVVASPTYKATYTGLLKVFVDRFGDNALAGVRAVPVMTGGAPIHALAVEHGLRPLLVELGASVPSRGLFFEMAQYDDAAVRVPAWCDEHLAAYFGPAMNNDVSKEG